MPTDSLYLQMSVSSESLKHIESRMRNDNGYVICRWWCTVVSSSRGPSLMDDDKASETLFNYSSERPFPIEPCIVIVTITVIQKFLHCIYSSPVQLLIGIGGPAHLLSQCVNLSSFLGTVVNWGKRVKKNMAYIEEIMKNTASKSMYFYCNTYIITLTAFCIMDESDD